MKNKDNFFIKNNCDRCGKVLSKRIMSMFNEDCICPECKVEEMKNLKYPKAIRKEHQAVKRGNLNYKGIGWPTKRRNK